MGQGKNKSFITHIEVGFREIDRFFDIHGSVWGDSNTPPPEVPTVSQLTDQSGTDLNQGYLIDRTGPTISAPGSPIPVFAPRYLPSVPALDSEGKVRLVMRAPGGPDSKTGAILIDENGEYVNETVKEIEGAYRSIQSGSEWFFARTFARQKSHKIDYKYVYVWAADDKQGGGIRLIRELFFHDGKFQFIDFNSSNRTPKGAPRETLVLDAISFQDGQHKQLWYFFLLARFQIPKDRLDEIGPDIPARGMRLWDEFYTDMCPDGNLDRGTPIDEPPRAGDDLPSKLTYRIHLVDPFREAEYRSERFRNALHRWHASLKTLSEDEEYTFAKNLEYLRREAEACPKCLKPDFGNYLREMEKEAGRRCFAMCCLASDVLEWIGRAEVRKPISMNGVEGDTWHGNGKDRCPAKEDKGTDRLHSHFCEAVHDYAASSNDLTGDPTAALEVGDRVCAVVEELDLSPNGDLWLKELFTKGMDHKLDKLTSGGLDLYFEAEFGKPEGQDAGDEEDRGEKADDKSSAGDESGDSKGESGEKKEKRVETPGLADLGKKGTEAGMTLATNMLKRFSKYFVEYYGKEALKKVPRYYRRKFGLKIFAEKEALKPSVRKVVKAEEKRIAKLIVNKKEYRAWRGSIAGLQALNFGLNVLIVCYCAEEAETGDGWARLEALGSLLDALKAGYETFFEHDEYLGELEEAGSFAGKTFKVIGFVSAAIDVATGCHEVYVAESVPAQVAALMSTVGAGMVFAGAFNEEHFVGWGATIVGALLQGFGSIAKEETDPLCVFLRNCRWGVGAGLMDSAAAWWKDEDKPWYHGKLSDLGGHDSVSKLRQLRCADYFIYYFVPEIAFELSGFDCKMKITMKGASKVIGPQATWQVTVTAQRWLMQRVEPGQNPAEIQMPQSVVLNPDHDCTDKEWTAGEAITYSVLNANEFSPEVYRSPWAATIGVKIKVLVYGDDRHQVERDLIERYQFEPALANSTSF